MSWALPPRGGRPTAQRSPDPTPTSTRWRSTRPRPPPRGPAAGLSRGDDGPVRAAAGPVAEPADGPWANRLREIADRAGLVIVAGMFTPSPDGRVYNTLRAVGGGVDAGYDKIHLFDAFGFQESETVAPGRDPVLISVAGVTIGLSTCYDVRFPGLYTRLADQGAEIICVAASWGAGPGKIEQWQLLTRARALDSTAFVLAAGQADPARPAVDRPGPRRRGSATAR